MLVNVYHCHRNHAVLRPGDAAVRGYVVHRNRFSSLISLWSSPNERRDSAFEYEMYSALCPFCFSVLWISVDFFTSGYVARKEIFLCKINQCNNYMLGIASVLLQSII